MKTGARIGGAACKVIFWIAGKWQAAYLGHAAGRAIFFVHSLGRR